MKFLYGFILLPLGAIDSEVKIDCETTRTITIPKSGTYLLEKAISLITNREDSRRITHISEQHLYDNQRTILLIRDLRDVVTSLTFWFRGKNYFWPGSNTCIAPSFSSLNFEDQVDWVVHMQKELCGIKEYAEMAIALSKRPNVYVCRFEDLIGPKGGGNRQQQVKTIKELAEFMGCPLSDQEIGYVADHLFGGTGTFRKGQINSWKNHFSTKNIQAFKEVMGQELIDLGYEENDDW